MYASYYSSTESSSTPFTEDDIEDEDYIALANFDVNNTDEFVLSIPDLTID